MDVDAAKQGDEVAHALAAADALGKASKSTSSKSNFEDITGGLRELDMEHYDEEDNGVELFGAGLGDAYYPSNDMDPYLKDKDDDSSEELEDITIKDEDAVLVCARNEDDVWIYEDPADGDSNMYVHHDIIIPAFPLCTAWLDCPIKGGEKDLVRNNPKIDVEDLLITIWVFKIKSWSFHNKSLRLERLALKPKACSSSASGNFIAVGSMEPSIEIWDLDIMDEVQPAVVLGGVAEKKKKKKGKKKSIKYKEDSHTDAVLGLAWNREYRNIIASASADKLVKIWDVATGKCDITMAHHTDKAMLHLLSLLKFIFLLYVQAIAWNHHVPQVLLSGSFDHTAVMKDGRIPSHAGFKWSVSADVESVAWDPHSEHSFVVSLEDGTVNGYDIRAAKSDQSGSKPSFTLHAHDKAVCSISYNPLAPNLLATGSTDKMVKLWDLSNNEPSCIATTNPKAGAVFSISFSQDNPFLLAIGGSKGRLEVWDTLSDAGVSRRYGNYGNQNRS
ncbi:transducin/WD40 repeat-like superfamily protein [Actinidia rufa]|uniref:Transducin/WD40 repeat-like superfamily protein n=1 Tax=Actinidia rufa TaxID=165716 RepID=A0A7J0H9B3_9ERIC|nr:transducin/WD40 repeat-like superfamily protein [Actinidia rufa]